MFGFNKSTTKELLTFRKDIKTKAFPSYAINILKVLTNKPTTGRNLHQSLVSGGYSTKGSPLVLIYEALKHVTTHQSPEFPMMNISNKEFELSGIKGNTKAYAVSEFTHYYVLILTLKKEEAIIMQLIVNAGSSSIDDLAQKIGQNILVEGTLYEQLENLVKKGILSSDKDTYTLEGGFDEFLKKTQFK